MNGPEDRYSVVLGISDPHIATLYSEALGAVGHAVRTVASPGEAASVLAREHCDVVVIDTTLGGRPVGLEFAHQLLKDARHPEVVVLASFPVVAHAVAIAKAGAFDYLSSPVSVEQVRVVVEGAGKLSRSRRSNARDKQLDGVAGAFFVSDVPAVQEMAALVRTVAATADAEALVVGESGVGKDIVARLIHSLSPQSRAPLVIVNLVDVGPEQLEERLFGTAEPDGSFQEGPSQHHGSFAVARGGTLVLRELSELPLELQPPMLQVIETRRFRPVRGTESVPFHARVVATTDREVAALVGEHSLHPALFYRLSNVTIRVPPLRERRADIPRLARAIMDQVASDAGRPGMTLGPDAISSLSSYGWPGNLRELRNVLTRLALLSEEDLIDAGAVTSIVGAVGARDSGLLRIPRSSRRAKASSLPAPKISGIIAAALDEPSKAERERIEEALQLTEGHRERAAESLGMSRTTLWTRMRLLGVDSDRFRKRRAR